jgi:TonB family protein
MSLMFDQLRQENERSLGIRWGLGFAVNAFVMAGLVLFASTSHPTDATPNKTRWVQVLRVPSSTARLEIAPPKASSLPVQPRRKAILPATAPLPVRQVIQLPSPPLIAEAPKIPAAVVAQPVVLPLPAPPPPKPILGSFSGSTTLESTQKRGDRMAVRISGFGMEPGVEATSRMRRGGATAWAVSSFDSHAAPAPPRKPQALQQLEPEIRPVEILSKPKPAYTQEARTLGIEGDVRVKVLFGTDGKVKVLNIVSGLGHGLDENAAIAALLIQFRPATRNGEPIEQAAVIRVQFQLAQ